MTPRLRIPLAYVALVLLWTPGCDSNPTAPTAPSPTDSRKAATAGPEAKPGDKNPPLKQNTRSFD